jgi:branched-chain amino acid transport system ATP-binding protein
VSLLTVEGVTKRFGGLLANDGISFSVSEGEVLGLIGPNGAGKSTLFNCIAGYCAPDAGRISFKGTDIAGKSPERVCSLGVARTFQIVRVFREMSVLENVMVGAFLRSRGRRETEARARELLERMGLGTRAGVPAGNLTVAEQKRVQMARALATRPSLLLLDEAVAGLSPQETSEAVGLIRKIRDEGITLVIVEHVMEVIMRLSSRVVVLDYGKKIAEGAPEEVARDREVIKAYLGEKRGAAH